MPAERPLPTPAELEILEILWERGPSSVETVRAALAELRETGYTTALKLLQIMHGKGLVTRDESARSHIYDAWDPPRVTQQALLEDLADRAFGGSTVKLAMRALSMALPTADELKQIRSAADRLERRIRETS
jgi:predicted transcriptional regulator